MDKGTDFYDFMHMMKSQERLCRPQYKILAQTYADYYQCSLERAIDELESIGFSYSDTIREYVMSDVEKNFCDRKFQCYEGLTSDEIKKLKEEE